MRTPGLFALIALTGCTTHTAAPPTPSPTPKPTACVDQASLVSQTPTPVTTSVDPLATDATGVGVCLHIDVAHLYAPLFVASTADQPGSTTPFVLTLFDGSGAVLASGAVITNGQTNPYSSTQLAWRPASTTSPSRSPRSPRPRRPSSARPCSSRSTSS